MINETEEMESMRVMGRFIVFMLVPPVIMFIAIIVGTSVPEAFEPIAVLVSALIYVYTLFRLHRWWKEAEREEEEEER